MNIKKFIHECVYGVPFEREVTKFRCDFVTTDGKEHSYNGYKWIEEAAFYNPIEYLCNRAHERGYLWDDDGVAYPMENIQSFKMILIAKGRAISHNQFKNLFLDKEVLDKYPIV